ncbi:hypothetical protein GCK72_016628 [Caenorhabditis remanei]|uniref:Uncharacterized protein n=1 Tax=Caenorhabditis remanei TaxID=31234 RepID=A0A6A5G5S9_CAERE|nr:hypothetical protein GCK72_016628 [Caenorhabditis remanei]KAF1750082.1 hypothetical protein GCK72_016628 [Caenorhabditis remanei]
MQTAFREKRRPFLLDKRLADFQKFGTLEVRNGLSVPEVSIEFSIGESQKFGDKIQEGVEECVEEEQPDQVIRNRQFQKTFHASWQLHFTQWLHTIPYSWHNPLLN